MTTGAKIGAWSAMGLALVMAIGFGAYWNTRRLLEANRQVRHTHEVIEGLEHVLSVLKDAETGQRGFIITGQDHYLEPYDAAVGELPHDVEAIHELLGDDAAEQAALGQVQKLSNAKLAELRLTIELRRKSGLQGALPVIVTDRGKKTMDALRGVIAEMEARQRQLLEEGSHTASSDARRTLWAIAVWVPIALLVLAAAAVALVRTVQFGGVAAPSTSPRKRWGLVALQYLAAAVIVAVAVVLQVRLQEAFGPLPTFVMLYPAVLLAASIGGGGPGILATVLAALAADYWFIPPYGSFSIDAPRDVLALGIFTAAGLFLSILAERLRRARWAEATSAAQERQLHELSRLNEELTQQAEELSQQAEELAQQNEELQTQSEEIHGLSTELQHRENLLQELLEAARLSATEQTVVQDICAAAKQMFGAAAAAVMVFEQEGDRLLVRGQAGLGPEAAKVQSYTITCFAELVIAENKTAALADTALRPDVSVVQPPGEEAFRAVLAAPLHTGRRPFGAVGIYSHQPQEWTVDHFRLAEWLAGRCANILETLRIQDSLARLAAIVESSDDAILSTDLSGIIQTWNEGADRLFGYRAEEIIGQPVTRLLPPERVDEETLIVERVGAGQRVEHLETLRMTKDGEMIDVSVTVSPVKDRDGRITGASKILRDITQRKRAEEALRQTAEDLVRSNKDLEQFAYVASHDLREPLRMVTGFMSLLKDHCQGKLDAKADQYIGFATEGASRMQTLIDDLLAYSRTGRSEASEPTDLEGVLDSVLQTLAARIEESAATITRDPLPAIAANRLELTLVFQNLVANALTFRGEHKPEIHVAAQRQANAWLLTVRDNGIGIDPQFAERIFLIFQRLHTREQYPGTGIGLAICKKVVERHGGRIWVESQPGKGSTFCFTIPDPGRKQG